MRKRTPIAAAALLVYIQQLVLLSHVYILCTNNNGSRCHAFQASTFQTFPKASSPRRTNDDADDETANSGVNVNNNDTKLLENTRDEWIATAQERLAGFFPFELDDWQLYAGGAICNGYNVVVSAPTGAGKTVIGEMALHWAWSLQNLKGIYTTPLKALSNEKYRDFCTLFSRESVGLSTGDVSINKGAKITIMTTEVYRNIAWRASMPQEAEELNDMSMVILDELHYMGHPGRGGVWEESIVTSPSHVQLIGLSATLANGPDICAWMESVTKRPTVLVQVPDHKRPVPLRFSFCTRDGLYPLFRDPDAGPGAPHGLLGLRGNGSDYNSDSSIMTMKPSKRSKNKGFGGIVYDENDSASSLLPKGLQVNPVLIRALEKRMQKVDRALEKQMQFRRSTMGDDNVDDSSRRRRKRTMITPKTVISQREARKERDRLLKKEMRRSVPSLHALIERLRRKELLPAICFIFSRVGCDLAARAVASSMMSSTGFDQLLLQDGGGEGDDYEGDYVKPKRKSRQRSVKRKKRDILEDKNGRIFRENGNFVSEDLLFETMMNDDMVQDDLISLINDNVSVLSKEKHPFYSTAGLLQLHQVKKVASAIIAFNERNEELAFDDDVIEQFLLGLGSHHAGMLPAHKSFVEVLYQRQLMKVVFATETLAAGINMPARTTVICAMAKRGNGSSMNLLDTSNLLQMAGRAGRRGKDTEGTCVIVATPFESHDDAAKILTDEIKPISSQFSPSYSLCVNLIARGGGQLNIAKQLVSQSFAMWENNRKMIAGGDGKDTTGRSKGTVFLDLVAEFLRDKQHDNPTQLSAAEVLDRSTSLKRASKALLDSANTLSQEQLTLSYLETEYDNAAMGNPSEPIVQFQHELGLLISADQDKQDISDQISEQQKRVYDARYEVNVHPFSIAAAAVNDAISQGGTTGARLLAALEEAREGTGVFEDVALDGLEITRFAKAAYIDKKRMEKQNKEPVVEDAVANNAKDSWDEFVSITNTLVDYGCLQLENESNADGMDKLYGVTVAGEQVGLLGMDNSLWNLVALGGAWEVSAAQDGDDNDMENEISSEELARATVRNLLSLTPSQLAGYISCLVPMNSRGSGATMIQQFQLLDPPQQEAIRKAFTLSDRLSERQSANGVSESMVCAIDISYCAVVTAWANGCSWSDALELSGLSPGDLARTLSRVLDAIRQLANLPYDPLRRSDVEIQSLFGRAPRGLDPRLKLACREACEAINRYPLKDSLMFDQTEEADEEDVDVDDEEMDSDEGT